MKKWLRRFAKLVVGLLVLLVLFIAEENVRGRILLAAYKRELRATGEILTLAELGLTNTPAPPDAATVELLAAAKKLPDWNPNNRWEAQTLRFMRPVISGAATFSWQAPISEERLVNNRWVKNTWPVVVEQLRSNAPTLSAAMEALRRNPRSVPYGFLHDPVFAWEQRDKLLLWLMWVTANNLREGNVDGAMETTLALARLGRTFQAVHSGYHRRFAQIGLEATWEWLQSGATNDVQLSTLQDIWSKSSIVPGLAKQSEAYRTYNLEEIEAQTWGARHRDPIFSVFDFRLPAGFTLWHLAGRYFDGHTFLMLSQEELRCERAVAQSRRWNSWQDAPRPRWSMFGLWFWAMPFSQNELWRYGSFLHERMLRVFEFETQREMTVAAIALQRFRLRHGRWPEKLEELSPEFLSVLPRDWMDGEPLRYRRNANDTFTLYSIGEDLRDDGGDPTNVPNWNFDAHPLPMWTGRDAVWPCVATDEDVAALKSAAAAMKTRHAADH